VHPGAVADAGRVIWVDLASIDNAASADRENLWRYWLRVVLHYAALGFDGFRCDAAYQVPAELWSYLIHSAKREYPGLQFFAETLGCTPEQTLEVARSGFDFIFNSSKWWDFSAPWCLEQYRQTSPVVSSVSFPESHDTERLAAELGGNHAAVRQRTVFAALFASGWMIPIGFEYGFRKRLNVVSTRPSDWEEASWDDTEFIGRVNVLKRNHRVWNEDGPIISLDAANRNILALFKTTRDGGQRGLLLINRDLCQSQSYCLPGVEHLLGGTLSLAWPETANATTLPPAGFQVFASSDAQCRS
jgi:starch synthase (maltosyl-transferring)